MIEDHHVRTVLFNRLPDLGEFSLPDEKTWIGFVLAAGNNVEGRDARRGDKLHKLIQVLAECRGAELNMHQYGSLPAGCGINQCPAPLTA